MALDRSLKLRATISPARLLAKQEKHNEAHSMLAEIYGWFTEGFDTAGEGECLRRLTRLSGRETLPMTAVLLYIALPGDPH